MTIEFEIPREIDIDHLESVTLALATYSDNVTMEELDFLIDLFTKLKH